MYAHAQAPCRIGIAGGGTDLPAWTKTRVGRCLSLAVDSYVHAVAITRPDRQVVASYSRLDRAACATEIANGLIRESALMHGWEDGFEVHTMSEVSSRGSGLGVSSAIAVALAATFARMTRLRADPRLADDLEPGFQQMLARDAWTVEIDRLRRPIGRQDHMAAAYGGLRFYRFERGEAEVERTFSEEDARWVADHLALVQLPEGHDSRAILQGVRDVSQIEPALEAVTVAVKAIEQRDVKLLGRALDLGQESKERVSGASPPAVTEFVRDLVQRYTLEGSSANRSIVTGAKVAGAGGGGHLIVACREKVGGLWKRDELIPVQHVAPDMCGVRSEGWQ